MPREALTLAARVYVTGPPPVDTVSEMPTLAGQMSTP